MREEERSERSSLEPKNANDTTQSTETGFEPKLDVIDRNTEKNFVFIFTIGGIVISRACANGVEFNLASIPNQGALQNYDAEHTRRNYLILLQVAIGSEP